MDYEKEKIDFDKEETKELDSCGIGS